MNDTYPTRLVSATSGSIPADRLATSNQTATTPSLPTAIQWPAVCETLWTQIAQLNTPGFFITAEVQQAGNDLPDGILSYIQQRLTTFSQGVTARKFVFRSPEWRIHLTFFPTTSRVEERYALKNKVMKTKKTMNSLSFPK